MLFLSKLRVNGLLEDDILPSMIGVAVGALADAKHPAPVRSVFEQSKHDWVQIEGAVEHFQQSSVAKNSN